MRGEPRETAARGVRPVARNILGPFGSLPDALEAGEALIDEKEVPSWAVRVTDQIVHSSRADPASSSGPSLILFPEGDVTFGGG